MHQLRRSTTYLRHALVINRAILFALALLSSSSLTWAGTQAPTEPPWLCDKLDSSSTGKQGVNDLRPTSEVQKRMFHAVLSGLAWLPQKDFQQTQFVQDQNQRIHVCLPARSDAVPETEYVVETDGRLFERSGNKTKFLNDPEQPMNARTACTGLIIRCFEAGPARDALDKCVTSARVCPQGAATASTAPCCPETCRKRYQEERQRGTNAGDALMRVFYDEPSCVPGVDACLRGECP
jgi:hypothetical protein